MKCTGYKTISGCPQEDFCIPEKTGDCPNFCPPKCKSNEHICKGAIVNGCLQKDICVPTNPKCPNMCPTFCQENEISCPQGNDKNGCPLPSKCIPANIGNCSNQCPIECNDDEIWCPGGSDNKGCPLPPKCIPKVNSNGCPNFCPAMCSKGMEPCPGFLDEKGCPTQHMCIHQVPGCPKYCPMDCPAGSYTCAMCGPHECPIPGECLPEIEGCDDHCPVLCEKDEKICINGQIPSEKCPHEKEYCFKNNNWKCPTICPIQCSDGYIKCSMGMDINGCPFEDYCIPENDPKTGFPAKCPTNLV